MHVKPLSPNSDMKFIVNEKDVTNEKVRAKRAKVCHILCMTFIAVGHGGSKCHKICDHLDKTNTTYLQHTIVSVVQIQRGNLCNYTLKSI